MQILHWLVSLFLWLVARVANYQAQFLVQINGRNVYRINGPFCNGTRLSKSKMKNIYLIDNGGSVTIIDPGFQVPLLGIKKALARIWARIDDVKIILCTHYHFDHTGTIKAIVEKSGAKVFAHPADIPYITGERRHQFPRTSRREKFVFRILLALPEPWYYQGVIPLANGNDVPGLEGFKVLETPGHTPGSVSFYNEDRGIIFTGDALQTGYCPFTMNPIEERVSMDKIARLSVHTVLPGDGTHFIGDAEQKLKQFLLI